MKKILTIIFAAFILILPYAGNADTFPPELIKMKDDLKAGLPNTALVNCQEKLVPIYDVESMEFLKFLEQTFQNKSANSTLTNIAIARYAEYKKKLRDALAYLKIESSALVDIKSQAYLSYLKCQEITNAYIDLGKERMIDYIRTNTAQKRASILAEKYQAIGNKLRDLNFEMAQMYGFFATFKDKSPGFLRQCITK